MIDTENISYEPSTDYHQLLGRQFLNTKHLGG